MRTSFRMALLAVSVLSACAKAPQEDPASAKSAEPAKLEPAQPRMSDAHAWISAARTAHAAADRAAAEGDLASAVVHLQAALSREPPVAIAAADAASVRRDLFAHAAQLALQLGKVADAKASIDAGLALPGRDPFRTQLLLLAVEVARAQRDERSELAAVRAARAELALD